MIKSFLYLIFCSILFYTAYAQTPPRISDIVYRADMRSPEEISEQGGFLTWAQFEGNTPDNNVANHLEGSSLANSTSNFISTSFSLSSVVNFGSVSYLDIAESGNFYIYRIRPNNNFYDINASLLNARDAQPQTSRLWNLYNSLFNLYHSEEEVSSLGPVSDDRIIEYVEVTEDMRDQFGDDLLDEAFWNDRWVNYVGYNHLYDGNRTSSQFYTNILPEGIIRMIIDEETGAEIPLAYSCMGSPSNI